MTIPIKKSVLGIGVSVTSYGEVLRTCAQWVHEHRAVGSARQDARYVVVLNVHSVMTGVLDSSFRVVLNSADLGTSDGMPLVWALRWLGARGQMRVYGPDLMLALCGQAARLGHRIFLYGGRDETLARLCKVLEARFQGLVIAGSYSPPFRRLTPEEDAACVERIRASAPDLIFVGLGAPKQESWMEEHKAQIPGAVMLGVGAAFDFHCGHVRQAPRWMQQSGLEWLFRLGVEPARLWRRYMLLNPLFVILWSLQMTGIWRFQAGSKERNT